MTSPTSGAPTPPPPNALDTPPTNRPVPEPKRTPFHDIHVALGAKMVPFAGYMMPIQYPAGITAEHNAVRTACGLFDVSRVGEFIVRGEDACDFLNYVTTNDVGALAVGQVQYSTILNERGTIEDDCLVYRSADYYMMVVNASNAAKDLAHIGKYSASFDCVVEDSSDATALLALQGPRAAEILAPLTEAKLTDMKYYWFDKCSVGGVRHVTISRTGYTGEDGFELYFRNEHGPAIWDALMKTRAVTPAGLGARDTLRLEMGMALYGNDIDDTVTPLEANLGWLVKMKKGDFVGSDVLAKQNAAGIPRKLVGFTLAERVVARHGYPVYYGGQQVDVVRSGTMSPTLNVPIATTYLPPDGAVEGAKLEVEIRGRRVEGTVQKLPFYKNASHL
ncbi:MAG: glycine cleavage system aminomethyltransferase GcvT [Gemmatimonadaceae bacterium]